MIIAYSMHPRSRLSHTLVSRYGAKKRPQVSHFIYPDVLKFCLDVLGPNGQKMVHTQIVKTGYEEYPIVKTSLIDAYFNFKAEGLRVALKLFDEMSERNVVTWTAMVYGYTRSSEIESVVELFERMPNKDIPSWNSIIAGGVFIIGCLGKRLGQFDEAMEVIKAMKTTPDEAIWGSLLNGRKIHGRIDLAEIAVKKLIEI
nr:pentatricopeptide repeat-containing protein At1g33350 [Tanacetum cinerariifolium]